MKIYFKTRSKARSLTNGKTRKVVDNGVSSSKGKRWAVSMSVASSKGK